MPNSGKFKIRARSDFAIGLADTKQMGDAKIPGGAEHVLGIVDKQGAFRVEVNLLGEAI